MIAELGHFALVLALVIALLQATLPLYGVYANIPALQRFARSSALMQAFCLLLSFAGLIVAFLQNDFTLDYVSRQSNTLLPYTKYRQCGAVMKVRCCCGCWSCRYGAQPYHYLAIAYRVKWWRGC